MEEAEHFCGVAALSLKGKITPEKKILAIKTMYRLLLSQQHRGQLSAGISSFDPDRMQLLRTYKRLGSVDEAFRLSKAEKRNKIIRQYAGSKLIGHVRYATCGLDNQAYAQPFERRHGRKWKWFSFGFNGQISNYSDLKKELLDKTDYHITLDTDTEIIMHYIARQFKGNDKPDLKDVFAELSKVFDGAWTLTFLNAEGDLIIARDPLGFKPLCYGENDDMFVAASESCALRNIGIENFKFLPPGHLLHVSNGKITVQRFTEEKKHARCMFEWVYFSSVASTLDDRSVYLVRQQLGKELAARETLKMDADTIVVPVPDTGKSCADSYAFALGVQSQEGLIRNRYIGRTFIEGQSREDKVKNKYTVLREVVAGKKVILLDDSVVRGTTLRNLITYIKEEGGAKEVHVRVSCPPIMGPCFYGIDMSTLKELFAPMYSNEIFEKGLPQDLAKKMAKSVNADSIRYQSIEGLIQSIGLSKDELCLACLNRNHPTATGKKLIKKAIDEAKTAKSKSKKRTYE